MCGSGGGCGCGCGGGSAPFAGFGAPMLPSFGACGDPAWLTLPSGESVTAICGGGLLEVCTSAHVTRWRAQLERLASALARWRAALVTATQASGDAAKAGALVSEYAKWFQRYQSAPKGPHWSGLGNDDRAQELATLVQDGACILQQMQAETARLQPGKAPTVDPGPLTPGPAPGFNDPFLFAGGLFLAWLLVTQVDW